MILAACLMLIIGYGQGGEPVPAKEEPTKLDDAAAEKKARELLLRMKKDDFAAKAASEEMVKLGVPAVLIAVDGTSSDTPRVRYWCVSVLSQLRDERGFEPVRRCLNDADPLVRAVAVWHVQPWWDKPGTPELVLSKLNDKSDFVAGWAMKVVVAQKYTKALPRLKALLKSENENVRYDVLTALTGLLGAEVIPTLKTVILEDKSPVVRGGALNCTTIIEPRTPKVAEVLLLGVRDQDEKARETAAKLFRKGFGEDFGYNHRRAPITQMKVIQQLDKWYKENADKFKWSAENSRFELPGRKLPEPRRKGTETAD